MKLPHPSAARTGLILCGLLLGAAAAYAQTSGQTGEQTGEQTGDQAADQAQAAEPAKDYSIDTSLATVDGQAITLGELISVRRSLPGKYQQMPDKVLYDGIVQQLVDQLLLAEAAKQAKLDTRPAVALSIKNQERAILADAYLNSQIEKQVTKDKVEALYKERYVDAPPVEEVKAAHILVKTEEEAKEIKAKLDAGADFAEMAKEHGTDGTAQRGGELGWFSHDQMVPEFADAVFAMETGTISDPVKTDFGWHIIKLEDRRERPAPPLEQVEAELRQDAARSVQTDVVEELRAEADIEIPEAPVPPDAIRADAMLDAAE